MGNRHNFWDNGWLNGQKPIEPKLQGGISWGGGAGFLGVLSVGLIVVLMVTGGGLALPFMKIPWYVWAFLLFLLILFLTRK